MSDTREKRTRQLTIKGQTMFDEQQEQLKERCENIWIKIEDLKTILRESSYSLLKRNIRTKINNSILGIVGFFHICFYSSW
jgi:hypothetical protein